MTEEQRQRKRDIDNKYRQNRTEEKKEANRKYCREYYKKNKKRMLEHTRKWNENNKERMEEYRKKYYKKNKEKIKEYGKKYREREGIKEKIKEYRKEYRVKNKEKIKEYWRDYQQKNPDAYRNTSLKANYGITLEDRNRMIEEQDGYCKNPFCLVKLSDIPERHVHVDHDHKTGEIRGIMCHECNTNLGKIEKNPLRFKGLLQIAEASTKKRNERNRRVKLCLHM